VIWNDPDIAIRWPLAGEPVLAAKDRAGKRFAEAEVFTYAAGAKKVSAAG
jgi:dTDP-4-dehydrorhamnose 3,5-epimerase